MSYKNYTVLKIDVLKELALIKQMCRKNVCFVIIGTLKVLVIDLNLKFIINVTMY